MASSWLIAAAIPGLVTLADLISSASQLRPQAGGVSSALDYTDRSPRDRVRIANRMGMRHGMDPPMRQLAAYILADVRDIPTQGSKAVAVWIRRKMTYLQEAPGVELLQGPYDSLATQTVDCDDAALLWQSLTRSAGLRTYLAGIGQQPRPGYFIHAVGYDAEMDQYYELIDDTRYGGAKTPILFKLPPGYYAEFWSDEPEMQGFWRDLGDGFKKAR